MSIKLDVSINIYDNISVHLTSMATGIMTGALDETELSLYQIQPTRNPNLFTMPLYKFLTIMGNSLSEIPIDDIIEDGKLDFRMEPNEIIIKTKFKTN